MLKFNKFYFSWKTLQTSFWNSDVFSQFISSCKPIHGNIETRALETFARPPRLRKKCRRHICDHKEIKVVRVLHPSERNRELHQIHYGTRKRRMLFIFGHIGQTLINWSLIVRSLS